jgi:UDP-glucose 4-epimerase
MKIESRKKILITGGLGYLGGRICESLIKIGFDIVIGTRRSDVKLPRELSACTVVSTHFHNYKSLEKACKDIDIIVHLAAMNANDCMKDPEKALLVNGLGTLNLLRAAKENKVKSFIYFSTVHVYGSPLLGILNESSSPKPVHDYSITHHVAEDYVVRESRQGSIQGIVLRISNAVGAPLMKESDCWGLVVNDLCKQVVVDKQIKLLSDDSIVRDYLSVSDICHTIMKITSSDDILEAMKGEIINITNGNSMSLREISDLIARRSEVVLGYYPDIKHYGENKKCSSQKLVISNKKAQSIGLTLDSDLSIEIDRLLIKSKKWFGVIE